MIQIAPQMRIMQAVTPADFRKGIDGLAAVCRKILKQDPFSGYIFVLWKYAALPKGHEENQSDSKPI